MATNYGLHCTVHNACSGHGLRSYYIDELEAIGRLAHLVKALYTDPANTPHRLLDLKFSELYWQDDEQRFFDFLAEHAYCDLIICDEYESP